jgi:hypothetical protein
MVRDMDLVRKIMLNIQAGDFYGGVEGYDDDAVNYHKALLAEKGLIEATPHYPSTGRTPPDIPDLVMIKRMTWEGHDFIEAIATDTKWNKVKVFLLEAGKDVTIETIKHVAKQLFGFAGS